LENPLPSDTIGLIIGRAELTEQGIRVHTRILDNNGDDKVQVMVSTAIPWALSIFTAETCSWGQMTPLATLFTRPREHS